MRSAQGRLRAALRTYRDALELAAEVGCSTTTAVGIVHVGLAEALSEREVLQLIAAGKSNRRIASELFVTAGTVKTHINNIYRKLDAHSRTQVLARARDLKQI